MTTPRKRGRPATLTPAERSAKGSERARNSMRRRQAEGWRSLAMLVPPDYHADLDRIAAATGETKVAIIGRLLAGEAGRVGIEGARS